MTVEDFMNLIKAFFIVDLLQQFPAKTGFQSCIYYFPKRVLETFVHT